MKYSDLSTNLGFKKNMQETNWFKLFPKWWAENDPLIEAIGKEVAYIKAQGIFELLNSTIKPPVLIWQNSIVHKEYVDECTINKIPETLIFPAPLYKTFGTIKLTNHTPNDITDLQIGFTDDDYIIIQDIVQENDVITIDVNSQKVKINNKEANTYINGDGVSYFKTSQFKYDLEPTVQLYRNDDDETIVDFTELVEFDGDVLISVKTDKKAIELYNGKIDENEIINVGKINYSDINNNFYITFSNSVKYLDTILTIPSNNLKVKREYEPLHNEAINLFICNEENIEDVNIDITITYDNVVFINEQNIEVTGLELIPIEKVELYAYYDFPYNPISNGWRKVYEKKYDEKTNVIYDMITTHFYTKKFYVEVYYKGLDYPYKMGFPAYKDAEKDSIYHINTHIDEWGKYFGLERREYKTNIPKEDYPFTFPQYYPFDIEQDYWYYMRLINEYAWNDLAIDEVDLIDTNGDPVLRLHSINPFVEDFVVYAQSKYPTERENINYNIFTPTWVNQKDVEAAYKRVSYYDTQNLLRYDGNKAYVTLGNKAGNNISSQKYLSKQLELFYDLSTLPENVNIEDIKVVVEAESTDNSLEKYSNSETGIIIHGISNTTIFPLIQSENYEMQEKEIEYNLSESLSSIKKRYDTVDSNVIQRAIIKPFAGKQNAYISIPFVLKENDEIVDDITEVYVSYNNYGTYKGSYHNTEDKGRYIQVYVPEIIPNNTIYKVSDELVQEVTITISCKTEIHSSFTSTEIPAKIKIISEDVEKTKEDEEEKERLIYLQLYGPFEDDELKTIYVKDEWHTGDIRNVMQKDGISFVNVFQNDNDTNTPTILLKNARLKIDHSPKKTNFDLNTQIRKDNLTNPAIAKLEVKITNTGDKELLTKIDIVHASNIKLSKHYIDVDLQIGDSLTETINIVPEYPIFDGQYEILTVCENKTCHNTITLSASGLIKTGISLGKYYSKYDIPLTIDAIVTNAANLDINDGISKVLFYINDFKVGESIVNNNKSTITIVPSDFSFITPGIHNLEARFIGNEKFASSRLKTTLIISKNNSNIDLIADDTVIYNKPYNIETNIYYYDDEGYKKEIKEGSVSFYLDDIKLGTVAVINGVANILINNMNYSADDYILTAVYNGTENYARIEKEKTIIIMGGETKISTFNINAKPSDDIILKAQVCNVKNIPLSIGYIVFKILDGATEIYTSNPIEVDKGVSTKEYHINDNILANEPDNTIKNYTISATYVDDSNLYQSSSNTAKLKIEKGEVIITNANFYFGSQYEPLGFYLCVKDASTNKPIQDGEITITIPNLNINCPPKQLDSDGGSRVIYNPINFTADEFNSLLKFYFQTGKLMPYRDKNNNEIKLYLDDSTSQLTNFEAENLYRIYEGDLADLDLMDFRRGDPNLNEDPNTLIYEIKDENSSSDGIEQIFVDTDGYLYARTNIDTIRKYTTGTYPLIINYSSNAKYKSKNKYANIQLNQGAIDVDVHSQRLTYADITKSVIAYVTEYNLGSDQTAITINEGKIWFFVDDIKVAESDVENGLAILSPIDLVDIPYGKHLLTVQYMNDLKPNTYTYADLIIDPITPIINTKINKKFKGETSKLNVSVKIDDAYDVSITGTISVYLDDVLIKSNYLLGIEDLVGNVSNDTYNYERKHIADLEFIIDMPTDIDVSKHELRIEYSGDDHILPASETIILEEEPVQINITTSDISVATGEQCHLSLEITSEDEGLINEGEVAIYKKTVDDKILQARSRVKNNKVNLDWIIEEEPSNIAYIYIIQYENGYHYVNPTVPIEQNIYVIEPQDSVCIVQDELNSIIPYDDILIFKDLQEALQCVKPNGNVHIIDTVNITEDITINKNVNIIGENNSTIVKDIPNLLTQETKIIQKYSYNDFNETIYEIVGLESKHLNIADFHIIDMDLFFVKNNTLIPIFLLSDEKFYAYQQISLTEIFSNISLNLNGETTINNLHFKSNDNNNSNDLIIKVQNNVNINKCIIDDTITINNQSMLKINNSLVYGYIIGSTNYNLDNNWWGSNKKPNYDIDNHIILKIGSNIDSPIIGDDIQIYAELIGENGVKYDIPSLDYYFESELGNFTIPSGKFIENIAHTTYIDSAKEDTIYCTVDNQTISLDILSYNHKTEVILDPATEIPIGYQIAFHAKVQSLADIYEDTKKINNGYVDFYITNQLNQTSKIGHAKVIDGEAELPLYFSRQQYSPEEEHNLKLEAIYRPENYYFTSNSTKNIVLINSDNVCYVSPFASENGIGSFDSPFDSIRKAIIENKDIIYLKPGTYSDNLITVSGSQEIRAYNGDCIFKNNDKIIFNGENNSSLILKGLTFTNNKNYIINNSNVNIEECIFYKNTGDALINHKENTKILYSVIVDNKHILSEYIPNEYLISKCWLGTNEPNDSEYINEPIIFNDYIIMDFESNKSVIYLGSVAHLTASLSHYCHDGNKILLDKDIPLRIAQFSTSYGSLTPLKDYTYNNKATTFLDTNKDVNSDKILLTTPNNTNYITKPLELKCYVQDVYENSIIDNDEEVRFKFRYDDNDIYLYAKIINGVATATYDTALNIGEYTLECNYKGYTHISTFKVTIPNIEVVNLNINDGDYIYDLSFDLEITDSFNSEHINQDVNILIDDNIITQAKIIDNFLHAHVTYNFLMAGEHKLTINTKDLDSEYNLFTISQKFIATPKNTYISFDYIGLSENEPTDLIIKVYDKDNRLVQNGSVDVKYDNEIVYVDDNCKYTREETNNTNIFLQNGVAIIYDFYSEEGQHSIAIHYNGDEQIYSDSLFVNNNFNVSLDEVIIKSTELEEQLSVDIGQPFILHFPIMDKYKNLVKRGNVNLLLDSNIKINNDDLIVDNGYVSFEGTLPLETKAMTHDFTITYTDPSLKYSSTIYNTTLDVKKIKTQIIIDTIYSAPDTKTSVDYIIESAYGEVRNGRIEAYYNNMFIGSDNISNVESKIELDIPLLSATEVYDILFKYVSTSINSYENSEENVKLIIAKPAVDIEVNKTEYYPNTNFDYVINVTHNNKNVNFGTVKLYIDNVETVTKQVNNGQVNIPLFLDTVKDYDFTVVYQENDYYSTTPYLHTFKVNNIKIQDIYLTNMHSIPNNILNTELKIITPDNINVTDGFVDFYIDNEKINTFTVVEDKKYVKLNIPNLDAGTHSMTFEYYNSEIFKDNKISHDFVIDMQDIILTTPMSYQATLNDTITFDTQIDKKIMGTLEYYLITSEDDVINSRFIGTEQINNKNTITFSYLLPNNLEQTNDTEYNICVKFIGNKQYKAQEKNVKLIINKETVNFVEFNIENTIEYRSTLEAKIKVDIFNATMIYFYLDSEANQIGYRQTNEIDEDGYINFSYNLSKDYYPNEEHTLIAVIKESVTLNKISETKSFTITKATPTLSVGSMYAYVGEKITLPTNVIDNKGFDVTKGTLKYYYNNNVIASGSPNSVLNYQLDQTYEEEREIRVEYKANSDDYYSNFEEILVIQLKKNTLNIITNNNNVVTRGTSIQKPITLSSNTVETIPNLTYKVYLEDRIVTLPTLNIPIDLPDKETYILKFVFDGNDMFYPLTKSFTLINKNDEEINLSNVDNLQSAFDLVANYGVINIDEDIEDIVITNNKKITINGKNHKLINCNIINNNKLVINNLTIKGSQNSAIKNNGELIVDNCIFEQNTNTKYGGAIYIDSENINTEITRCTFKQNVASIYGGAIFSNNGNDVTIKLSKFVENNNENIKGTSIASIGNIYLSQNMFYDNNGKSEIYIINGTLEAENNYFDGAIVPLENKGEAKINLNYWGYNDISKVTINGDGEKVLETWLIADYDIDYTQPYGQQLQKIITVNIDKYKDQLNMEEYNYKKVIGDVPIKINNNSAYLNQPKTIIDDEIIIKVGQEEINVSGN